MPSGPPKFPWPVSEIVGIVGFLAGVAVTFALTRSLPIALIAGTALGGVGALLSHPGAALTYLGAILVSALMLLAWAMLRPEAVSESASATGPSDFRAERFRFFESGPEHPPIGEREYARSFDSTQTRYVCWQLDASFAELSRRTAIRIEYVYFAPDGSVLGSAEHTTHLEKGWVESWHSRCWGWDAAGDWGVGNYRVTLTLDGETLIRGGFAVY